MTYVRKLDAIFEKVKAALFYELEDPAWVLRREERKLIVELVKDEDDRQEDCHGDVHSTSSEGDVRVKEEPSPIPAEDLADIRESEDEKMIALGGSFDWTQLEQLPENQSKYIRGRIRGPNGKFMRTRKKRKVKSEIPQPGGRKKGSKNKSEVEELLANVKDSTCNICGEVFDGGSSLSRHLRQSHSAVGLVVDGVGKNSEEEETVLSGTDAQLLLDSLDSASQPKKARTIPCFVCGAHYRIKSWLYKHLNEDHPNESISCCVCQSRLDNFAELTRHLTEMHEAPNPILICDLCGVYSVTEDQQVVHVKEAHPEEAEVVACPLCPRELLSLAKLDGHLSESHEMTADFGTSGEISQFECRACKLVFTDVASADSHEHTEEEKDRASRKTVTQDCPHCGDCVTDLKTHLARSHPEQQAYKCKEPNCRYAFPTLDRLTRHMRQTHPKDPDLKAICDLCAKVFPNANRARRHMKAAHTTEKFFCNVCGKQCSNQDSLWRHRNRYHSNTDHCCHICQSKFSVKSNLMRHIQTVHMNTKLTCPECGKTFTLPYHLSRHRKSVHDGKRYPCKLCDNNYSQLGDLNKHVKLTHQENDFQKDVKREISLPMSLH